MPVTRSASGATARKAAVAANESAAKPVKVAKRKAPSAAADSKTATNSRKKAKLAERTSSEAANTTIMSNPTVMPAPIYAGEDAQALVPAVLTFSFEDAKQHLFRADRRFEDVFNRMKCKPFEHLERVDPFRTLAHSIMGQQISWLAARSIIHRFIRLFDQSLPEKPADHSQFVRDGFLPTAKQVAGMDIATLRSAGLSGRKAEYVLDLAARFADGRLSTEKLLEASDEDLYEMLTEVRGIGRWTVDMFALFSLRRPDILPVGDLGVQRGVLRWFLSLHAPSTHPLTISPAKLPKNPAEDEDDAGPNGNSQEDDTLPVLGGPSTGNDARPPTPDMSSVPPAPGPPATPARRATSKGKGLVSAEDEDEDTVLPAPFTPSINKTLNMNAGANGLADLPPPLPAGLTPAVLKSRLEGKKKIKGALLTPQEMEELTESWRPYRSLGVLYVGVGGTAQIAMRLICRVIVRRAAVFGIVQTSRSYTPRGWRRGRRTDVWNYILWHSYSLNECIRFPRASRLAKKVVRVNS